MRLIIFLMLVAEVAIAQNQHAKGSIYFAPGIQQFSFSNLNNVLSQAGYHEVPLSIGIGTGGYGQFKHLRFGGEGSYFSGTAIKESTTTEIEGGWGYFYGGYKIGQDSWRIIPSLGIGWGGCRVNAIQTIVTSLDDLINNSLNSSRVYLEGIFLHAAITMEYDLSGDNYLGIKASYNQAFSKNPWAAPGLTNSVSDSFTGFQISLIIGFTLH